MCGIAGVFNPKYKVTKPELKSMTDSLIHRGPDGEGHWISSTGCVGFGHRRLSILDLSQLGHQPMSIQEGRYTITFNGEIYNYIELRKQLTDNGISFHSRSDTEVLLWLYAEYGEKCLNMLDGMFAFAIWDEETKQLFIARDRFGEKPLFYAIYRDSLYFGSEMKALWAAGVPRQIVEERLTDYILSGRIQEGVDTHFSGIKRLLHSHFALVDSELNVKPRQYWSLDNIEVNQTITFERAVSKYQELFFKSVERRLRSDVTVGSSLSGGVDSSSVVCVIDFLKKKRYRQNVFSARFSNFAKDEGVFIEIVKRHCQNVDAFEIYPNEIGLDTFLEKIVHHQEEPFGSSSISAQWLVMGLAKEHDTTVLLDGQGADEFLAGYLPCYDAYLSQLFYTDPNKYNLEYAAYIARFSGDAKIQSMYEKETLRMKLGRYKKNMFRQQIKHEGLKDYLKKMLFGGSLQQLLRYADRNSMAHSREVRLPFLSHELIEFVFSLPDEFLLQNGWTKYVHRKALEPFLPKEIAWRVDKIGFEPPQKKWLENEAIQVIIEAQAQKLGINRLDKKIISYTNDLDWRLLISSYYKI